MSINHLINPDNPWTNDEEGTLNIKVGVLDCEYINISSRTSGKNVGGTTLTFSDPATMSGSAGTLYFAKGSLTFPSYTYILKLNVNFSAPLTTNTWFVDVNNSIIDYVGNFETVVFGQLCSNTPNLAVHLIQEVQDEATNTVRLRFQTADGSNIVAGSFSGSIQFSI
jgi:hypothetical protein